MFVKLLWVLGLVAAMVAMTVFRVRRLNAARSRARAAPVDVR
jgi:beta-lactamase regulating signal transducer with metallopeptidase domain